MSANIINQVTLLTRGRQPWDTYSIDPCQCKDTTIKDIPNILALPLTQLIYSILPAVIIGWSPSLQGGDCHGIPSYNKRVTTI